MSQSVSASSLDLETLLGPGARRSPNMEAVWDWMLEQDAGLPNWMALPPAEARALHARLSERWNADLPAMAAVEPMRLAGNPPVKGELYVPKSAKPGCILYLHGGGWSFGSLKTYGRLMRLLAEATGMRVLGVEYRLAPEHPFPAPFEDCLTAWRAVADNRHDPDYSGPLVVAGDSAGANLAVAIALNEIAQGRPKPDAALLFYGAFDTDIDTPSYKRFAEGYGLSRANVERFYQWYVPEGQKANPLVSPLRASEADLARLPPLFINAAGLDPLLCDAIAFAKRAEAASVPHRFIIHEGVHHGFMQMSLRLPEANTAIREAAAFLEELPRR